MKIALNNKNTLKIMTVFFIPSSLPKNLDFTPQGLVAGQSVFIADNGPKCHPPLKLKEFPEKFDPQNSCHLHWHAGLRTPSPLTAPVFSLFWLLFNSWTPKSNELHKRN
jgi:hypothetical protein